ncbi:MAG: hypothetical protein IAG10_34250 [Planctomycetaceae bacterium]|nr:hypothetical protein [Planctomycetaceae bacterium]
MTDLQDGGTQSRQERARREPAEELAVVVGTPQNASPEMNLTTHRSERMQQTVRQIAKHVWKLQAFALVGHIETLRQSSVFASLGSGISAATSSELLFPLLAQRRMRVGVHPMVDRGRPHAAATVVWMLAPQPSDDLFRRPRPSQSRRHNVVNLRPLQQANDRPLAFVVAPPTATRYAPA